MGIGLSIFLIALGAIIAFGIRYDLTWMDLDVVGWVVMLAGLTLLIFTLHWWRRRRRASGVVEDPYYYSGRATPPPPRRD